MRRSVRAITVVIVLLLGTAACGDDDATTEVDPSARDSSDDADGRDDGTVGEDDATVVGGDWVDAYCDAVAELVEQFENGFDGSDPDVMQTFGELVQQGESFPEELSDAERAQALACADELVELFSTDG